jgi:hypothetical protein
MVAEFWEKSFGMIHKVSILKVNLIRRESLY